MKNSKFIAIFVLVFYLIQCIHSLTCYSCTSLGSNGCRDSFKPDQYGVSITNCPESLGYGCIVNIF